MARRIAEPAQRSLEPAEPAQRSLEPAEPAQRSLEPAEPAQRALEPALGSGDLRPGFFALRLKQAFSPVQALFQLDPQFAPCFSLSVHVVYSV